LEPVKLKLLCLSIGHYFTIFKILPQIREGYPLNLSILIRGGKENNYDVLSNGE